MEPISSDDVQTYPRFTQAELIALLDEIYAGTATPYRSMDDATILSARHYRIDEASTGNSIGGGAGFRSNRWRFANPGISVAVR